MSFSGCSIGTCGLNEMQLKIKGRIDVSGHTADANSGSLWMHLEYKRCFAWFLNTAEGVDH